MLVKPSAVKQGLVPVVRQQLCEQNLDIIQEGEFVIKRSTAVVIYNHIHLPDIKQQAIDHLVSGPCYSFMVFGETAIQDILNLRGNVGGNGIRGRYSVDRIQNVIHAPDNQNEAIVQLQLLMPELCQNTFRNQLADEFYTFLAGGTR